MEDIRIGRELAAGPGSVTITGPARVQIVGANPDRVRLFISGDGATTVWVGPDVMTIGNGQGIALVAQEPVFLFRIEEFGKMVPSAWFAFVQAGTVKVSFIESTLAKQ
jgi:hypothetical protein